MTSPYFATRRAQKLSDAVIRLTRLEVGETLEISDLELATYREARAKLPEREFTGRRVDRGEYVGVLLRRKS